MPGVRDPENPANRRLGSGEQCSRDRFRLLSRPRGPAGSPVGRRRRPDRRGPVRGPHREHGRGQPDHLVVDDARPGVRPAPPARRRTRRRSRWSRNEPRCRPDRRSRTWITPEMSRSTSASLDRDRATVEDRHRRARSTRSAGRSSRSSAVTVPRPSTTTIRSPSTIRALARLGRRRATGAVHRPARWRGRTRRPCRRVDAAGVEHQARPVEEREPGHDARAPSTSARRRSRRRARGARPGRRGPSHDRDEPGAVVGDQLTVRRPVDGGRPAGGAGGRVDADHPTAHRW